MGETERILLGGLSGVAFGAAVALLGAYISNGVLRRRGESAVMAVMAARMLLDAAALGAVYLMRHVLPLPFEPIMIGTALGLSLTGIVTGWKLSHRLSRGEQTKDTQTGGGK
ncbi:MAG: hypothetical protein J5482_00140 [Oscillospiraceae bacterium]|nr:hypothetical protein [Oscillospiraceae bacterium]